MLRSAISLLFIVFSLLLKSQPYYPTSNLNWEKISPEQLGWNTAMLDSLKQMLSEKKSKSFVLLHKGKIVVEWYYDNHSREKNWYWASAGKTLTAGLVGIAESKRQLQLTDQSNKYLGKAWTSCDSTSENKITIWHQLTMTTGLDERVSFECTLPTCLKCRVEPGTRWFYHNAPYTLLDGIIEGATGQNLNLYFRNEIGQKTGMDGLFLKVGDNNVFYSTTLSMARYGLLLLREGKWQNQQIIPDIFIKKLSSSSQTINPSYGFLTWLNGKNKFTLPGSTFSFNGMLIPEAPPDLYAALGKNDQKLYVVPSLDMVAVRMGEAAGDSNQAVPIILDREIWRILSKVVGYNPSHANSNKVNQHILKNTLVTNGILEINEGYTLGKCYITNPSGKKVMDFSDQTADLSALTNGLYYVHLRDHNDHFIKIEKVIKL